MKKAIIVTFNFLICNLMSSQNAIPATFVSGLPDQIYDFEFNNNYIYYTVIGGPAKQIGRVNFVANTIPEVIVNNIFPIGLTIHNNILYYSELFPARISEINLTIPTLTPTQLPIAFLDSFPWEIKVINNELHFSESIINLKKVPLSNLSQTPIVVSQFPQQFDFFKEGNFYYTTTFMDDQINNVLKFDLSNPANPQIEDVAEILEPTSLAKIGNLLFVGTNDSKIYKINLLQQNAQPELFYEVNDGASVIGKLLQYNNELYFSFNQANFVTQTYEGKIMKFTQNQLSNESFDVSELELWPNPANDKIHLSSDIKNLNFKFFNHLGQEMKNIIQQNNIFDISSLPFGSYFLKISNQENFSKTIQFVKK